MDLTHKSQPEDTPVERCDNAPPDSRTVSSESLLQGGNELQITHRGEVYRLRVTRSGKLILNK